LETIAIADLRPHPRNYRTHPDDQIEHLVESIRENGFYRNIVVSRDGVILAGHGVVEALRRMGFDQVRVARLGVDSGDPRALKVLTGDNEIARLGMIDDRVLSEMLREIKEHDARGLAGTGYDEQMLANLVYVTRPQSEIRDRDEAAEWVGMPEFEREPLPLQLRISFRNAEHREEFGRILGLRLTEKTRGAWWPPKEMEDPGSLMFEG